MSDIIFRRQGKCFVPSHGAAMEYKELPPGTYSIQLHESPMGNTLHLVVADDLGAPGKLYGNTDERAQRVIKSFLARPNITTGVLLRGERGTGKTLLAKRISALAREQHNIPTLLLSDALGGTAFAEFLGQIRQPSIVLVDEFEKVFDEPAKQNHLLPILDGAFSGHKLFIFIVNEDSRVDTLRDRPGRIHYQWNYNRLEHSVVHQYGSEHLKNKDHLGGFMRMMRLVNLCTFDVMKALVWEMNQYNEKASKAIRNLNIEYQTYLGYRATVKGLPGTPNEGREWIESTAINMVDLAGSVSLDRNKPSAEELLKAGDKNSQRMKLRSLRNTAMQNQPGWSPVWAQSDPQPLFQMGAMDQATARRKAMGAEMLQMPAMEVKKSATQFNDVLSLSDADLVNLSDDDIGQLFDKFALEVKFSKDDLVDEDAITGTFTYQTDEFLIKLDQPRYDAIGSKDDLDF